MALLTVTVVKKNLSIWIWGITGFCIFVALFRILDGWQGYWGTVGEPGVTGAAIGATLRAFVFTQKERSKTFASTKKEVYIGIETSRDLISAVKDYFGKDELDLYFSSKAVFGTYQLSETQLKDLVVKFLKEADRFQNCRIHFFFQGPPIVAFNIARWQGLNFDVVLHTFDTSKSQYADFATIDRTWMV